MEMNMPIGTSSNLLGWVRNAVMPARSHMPCAHIERGWCALRDAAGGGARCRRKGQITKRITAIKMKMLPASTHRCHTLCI